MEFLRFLEGIRTPFFDELFSFITHLGEETIFIVIGFLFFWCLDKKKGYYILFVGFSGLIINQALKITCRVPRPWVKDSTFTIVESARAEATGYSFPSGHTQISVGAYGSIARCVKDNFVRAVTIAVCVLVPFSRMYLGVHTPQDVFTSVAIALILIFGLYPVVNKCLEEKKKMRILMGVITGISILYVLYVKLYNFPGDIDMTNYADAVANAFKMTGCMLGVWLGFEIDERFIKFETTAVWWAQALKLLTGLVPTLLIKSFLKAPLNLALGSDVGGAVRYFLIVVFAMGIWPLTFKFFNALGREKNC